MILPILLGLAQLAPAILPLFDSDNESTASKAANAVSEVAKAITGTDTEDKALEALQSNPEMLIEYQRAMTAKATALYQAETERLRAVNETIRAEIASSDAYVRRMRPTFGYIVAASFAATMFAVAYTLVTAPQEAGGVVSAVANLGGLYTPALAVLGVYVYGRTQEKKPGENVGVLGAVAKRIAG